MWALGPPSMALTVAQHTLERPSRVLNPSAPITLPACSQEPSIYSNGITGNSF